VAAAKPVVAVRNGRWTQPLPCVLVLSLLPVESPCVKVAVDGLHLSCWITERRSASEDLRGVDVRLDPGSRGLPAQQLMSLLKILALLDQHPDGVVQHR
jgi:hypothetical protein